MTGRHPLSTQLTAPLRFELAEHAVVVRRPSAELQVGLDPRRALVLADGYRPVLDRLAAPATARGPAWRPGAPPGCRPARSPERCATSEPRASSGGRGPAPTLRGRRPRTADRGRPGRAPAGSLPGRGRRLRAGRLRRPAARPGPVPRRRDVGRPGGGAGGGPGRSAGPRRGAGALEQAGDPARGPDRGRRRGTRGRPGGHRPSAPDGPAAPAGALARATRSGSGPWSCPGVRRACAAPTWPAATPTRTGRCVLAQLGPAATARCRPC